MIIGSLSPFGLEHSETVDFLDSEVYFIHRHTPNKELEIASHQIYRTWYCKARCPELQCDLLDEFPQSAPTSQSMSVGEEGRNPPKQSMTAASMLLSVMLRLGKVITPKTDFVTLPLGKFSVKDMTWRKPFQERFSLQNERFASGTFHNAYEANALSGIQDGKYVFKKMKTKFLTLRSCLIV